MEVAAVSGEAPTLSLAAVTAEAENRIAALPLAVESSPKCPRSVPLLDALQQEPCH